MKIYTLGCKVNQVESLKIEEEFLEYNSDDIIIINTCTLTEKADAKCRNLINRMLKNYPDKRLVVTGCLVERIPEELKKKYPNVIFVRNKDKNNIVEILRVAQDDASRHCDFSYRHSERFSSRHSERSEESPIQDDARSKKTRAFLKIQDGCDHFCSYCIVPYVRWEKWSMPIADLDAELNKIYAQGFKEIVLTGIRIGFYEYIDDKGKIWHFEDILERIVADKRVKRIRISSIEPTELTDRLIDTIAENTYIDYQTEIFHCEAIPLVQNDAFAERNGRNGSGGICPHLHIAFQSGSDKILKSMGRGYDTQYLRDLVSKLRSKIKDLSTYCEKTKRDFTKI